MKRHDSHSSILLILERGEELQESLQTFALGSSGLESAWLTGLGGAMSATLGFYDFTAKSYVWKTFDEPLEIVSLTGNLSFVDGKPLRRKRGQALAARTPLSDALSKDLLQRGFKFAGSTICYSFMQAVGIVNDHDPSCFRYREV